MKKYLFGILLAIITMPSNAAWHIYPDDGCAILPWVFPAHWGNDDYYFCGAHKTSCNNDNASDNEVKKSTYWYNNSEYATLNNERYWCCGGSVTSKPDKKNGTAGGKPGKWVKGPDWIVNIESVTENVGGGKCTYLVKTDICGNKDDSQKDIVCKAQIKDNIECPDGQHYRNSNGTCAALCKTGYAFESEESNRCVECTETSTRGIVSATGDKTSINIDPMDRICKTCPASTSIFDPETRECISKSQQMTALSTTELLYGRDGRTRNAKPANQCWTKFGKEYKDCVLSGHVSNNKVFGNDRTVTFSDTVINDNNKNIAGGILNTGINNKNNTNSNTSTGSTSNNTTSGNNGSGGGGGRNNFITDPVIDDHPAGGHKFNLQYEVLEMR